MFTVSAPEKAKGDFRLIFFLFNGLLVSSLSLQSTLSAQTTYYVANSGSDSNNGTTTNTPFQSLAKVNSLALQAGDQVLFRRGDTFRGTLTIRRSGAVNRPIIFDAYGTGVKPVLSGAVPVTNWTNLGNNIWQAPCSSCGPTVTGVYRSGKPLPLGRFPNFDAPNKGYMTIRAHTEKYQIFSQEQLPYNIDWKGGEVVMRPTQWIIDRAVIDAQYGDALNLFNYSNYFPADGWGYFIQSHPATLDQNDEWYYDPANKQIKLYSDQTSPNSQTITATAQSRNVDMANVSNIVLRNLQLTQPINENLFATNVSSFSLVNSDLTDSGEDGLIIKGTGSTILIENNTITDINNNGFYIDAYKGLTFRGNNVRRIGTIPGRGKSGDGQYNGIQSNADENVLIENNKVDSVGYNGISFWANTTIKQNVISNYCMTKSDGGGLYVWNGNKRPMTNIHIISNIIYNGIGAPEGSFRQDYSGANGIFLDECDENVEIRGNTVLNNHQWGVFLHGSHDISFTNNTVFDNNVCQFVMYHNGGRCTIRNNVVKNNVFVSKQISQLVAQYEAFDNDILQYGTIDSNYYTRPFSEGYIIRGVVNATQGGNFRLNEWQQFSGGHDLHSKSGPRVYNQYKNDGAGGVNKVYSTFETGLDGWTIVYSRYNNAQLAIDSTNKLDGESLRLSFSPLSGQSGSYAQLVKRIGKLIKGKTYVLRFDAVASDNVSLLAYIRQYGPPYREFDGRYLLPIGTSRKSYEVVFTASDNDYDPIIMLQTDQENPVIWLDNVRLQEDVPILNAPDDFIKIVYNPTLKDSTVVLPAGAFLDVRKQAYSTSLVLKPFTSIVLFRDTIPVPPADLSLSLYSDKRVIQLNEPTSMRIKIRNEGETPAALARWTYRLPANMQFVDPNGQAYTDNVLTGTVTQLAPGTDTTFSVLIRPTATGLFRMAAQLTTETSYDPDSRPNTGTADGEDDTAMAEVRVGESFASIYESPNPNQRVLPEVVSNQPSADPAKADLSVRMAFSKRAAVVGEVVSCTISITNAGGSTANGVQLQNRLPDNVELVEAAAWTVNGRLMTTTAVAPIMAGATVSVTFQLRATQPGSWVNHAQVSASGIADPDSTPNNGFTNGEDDQTQADIWIK